MVWVDQSEECESDNGTDRKTVYFDEIYIFVKEAISSDNHILTPMMFWVQCLVNALVLFVVEHALQVDDANIDPVEFGGRLADDVLLGNVQSDLLQTLLK